MIFDAAFLPALAMATPSMPLLTGHLVGGRCVA